MFLACAIGTVIVPGLFMTGEGDCNRPTGPTGEGDCNRPTGPTGDGVGCGPAIRAMPLFAGGA